MSEIGDNEIWRMINMNVEFNINHTLVLYFLHNDV